MMPTNKLINVSLLVLAIIALGGIVAGSNQPIIAFLADTWLEGILYKLHVGNEIVFSLSVGFLVSLFLWVLVVWLPEQRKRNIIRNNLARQYQNFKTDTISILLVASNNAYNSKLLQKLCNHQEFKNYFNENKKKNWYAALNGLQEDKGHLNDLLVEIELFASEIAYVLNNVDFDNEKVHSFFKNLSTHVYKLRNSTIYNDDHVKALGNFLFSILASWSFIEGQLEADIVQIMIDEI